MGRSADTTGQFPVRARTLGSMTRLVAQLAPVARKQELEPGDLVVVRTRNSVYRLLSLGGDTFSVSGGWFARSRHPQPVTVSGCTFGGRAICTDVVAAPGLFLEFGNNVSTTRIQEVRIVRCSSGSAGLPN